MCLVSVGGVRGRVRRTGWGTCAGERALMGAPAWCSCLGWGHQGGASPAPTNYDRFVLVLYERKATTGE
jgi:hypothetical protein